MEKTPTERLTDNQKSDNNNTLQLDEPDTGLGSEGIGLQGQMGARGVMECFHAYLNELTSR